MVHDREMTNFEPSGPGPDTVVAYITETWPETDVVEAMNAWFFSLDPEKHWPNYATVVTTDEHDEASNLSREGAFRLNIGVDRETFERVAAEAGDHPDYTAFDRVLPHPLYAAQRWICIVNPGETTFRDIVVPLLTLAHDRLAAQRARHGLET
jgi:Family of unknown function (DUF6194)